MASLKDTIVQGDLRVTGKIFGDGFEQKLNIDGSNATAGGVSTMLNTLTTGSSTPVDNDYYISQYVNGGTTTISYHRRPMSALWTYIKGKLSGTDVSIGGNAATATKATQDGSGNVITSTYATKTELSGKANSTHNHSASDINSGTLSIERGGSGAATAKAARYNLLTDATIGSDDVADSNYFAFRYQTPSADNGAIYYRTANKVWNWIKSKITWNDISGKPSSFTPASHAHGRLANGGSLSYTQGSSKFTLNGSSFEEAPSAGYLWHDVFAFGRGNPGKPSVERMDASGNWSETTLNMTPFLNKNAAGLTVVTSGTATTQYHGTRWTWKNCGWTSHWVYLIGFSYQSTSAKVDIIIECSSDSGETWTNLFTGENASSANVLQLMAKSHNGSAWVRLTIKRQNLDDGLTGASAVTCIKALTTRWGDQGGGKEYEYPYQWDANLNILPVSNNVNNLGSSSTKWADVYATNFNGALKGNADTATKATQDASGNVITSTYATKTELNGKASSTHTHGNITNGGALQTNDITIASGDKLVVTDSSDSNKIARTSIEFDGSTATKALTQKGTWETFLTSHQDISGKLNKSGDTMSGALQFSKSGGDGAIYWSDGTWRQRIMITDDSNADTAVFSFQQSNNSGSSWTELMTIKDNGKVVSNTFVGALSGNASSATKATQDGSGNNIVDTYATKTELSSKQNDISNLIPTAASSTNPLCDKAYADAIGERLEARYLGSNANGDPFATHAALTSATKFYYQGAETTPDTNDITTVIADEDHKNSSNVAGTTRYRYNGTDASGKHIWSFEYVINNSGLSEAQLLAVNSGVTSTKVGNYDSHLSNTTKHITADERTKWNGYDTGKQDKLTAGSNITISGNTISATNTTYSSKTAASGGTEVSLVTTGEKYTWNSKGTYSKPSGGIPKTDLASAVQTSLDKADSALQSVSVTDSNPTLSWGTKSTVGTIAGTNVSVTMPDNPNTDYRVKQSAVTSANYRPLLMGAKNDTTHSSFEADTTDQTFASNKLYAQPSTGLLAATSFRVNEKVSMQYNTSTECLDFVIS